MDKQTEQMFAVMQSRIDTLEKKFDFPIVRANKGVDELTPYTQTKTAYIDDTDVVFLTEVKGNLTVYLSEEIPYTVQREADRITVSFEPLEKVTEVTISIL